MGPSGAGKDTLIRGALDVRPDLVLARRVITRPADAATEDFDAASEAEFETRRRRGDFALWWRAHGLFYGIPASIRDDVASGRCVLFNGSRNALPEIKRAFPDVGVILITVSSDHLRQRLIGRGRETADQIEARLAAAEVAPPDGAISVSNDGAVAEGVVRLLAAVDQLCVAKTGD